MINTKQMILASEATIEEQEILKEVDALLIKADNLLAKLNLTIDGASPKPRPR